MNPFADTEPHPDRHPIVLTPDLTALVLVPFDGYVIVGFFWKRELLFLIDQPAGQA